MASQPSDDPPRLINHRRSGHTTAIVLALALAAVAAGWFFAYRRAPALVGRIAQIGLIDCFAASVVDANGRPLSCETSAVEIVNGRVLVVSDKETAADLPSPVFWLPIERPWPDVVASAAVIHEANAILRGTRKIEGLTTSAEGDLVFAASDFDWPPDDTSAEPDLYNRIVSWPIGNIDRAAVVNPTTNQGVVSSVSLRPAFIEALKSDRYPAGPPYFKIEGLVAMPNRELWFGIREVGTDFEHPDYSVAILKASYEVAADGTVTVRVPFAIVDRIDTSFWLPGVDRLGLSSLARSGNAVVMTTSREAPEGQVGHVSYLWVARPSARGGLDVRVVTGTDGNPLQLPCKAEGVDTLSVGTLLVVCDEDRSPTAFPIDRGRLVTRRPDQGVVLIVEVSGPN
jgi:hypothetical protein